MSILPLAAGLWQRHDGVMSTPVLVRDSGFGSVATCSLRWWHRLRVRLWGWRLDRQLAGGADVDSRRDLVLRARRLISPRFRYRLARGWADALHSAARSRRLGDPRIPVDARAVAAAEPEIRRLVTELTAPQPVAARGVALAAVILSDGSGPLYRGRAHGLRRRVAEAIKALDPFAEVGTA